MSVFRFLGFSTGADVDVTAAQGTNSERATVSGWGQTAATPITLSLGATRLTGTAPAGIQFTATATSPAARVESPFHDIEYVWSFDDPGNYRYLDNAPLWSSGRNIAYGPVVSHVFSAPGTYVITCTAHDGENPPKSEAIEIVVADPNVVFGGTNTAVVSLTGNFAGAPSGATQHTTIAAAVAALAGKTNQRLLLRRGETHTGTVTFTETSGSGKKLMVGDFGTGSDANPLMNKTSGGNGVEFKVAEGVATELMTKNIDTTGDYDPTGLNTGGSSVNGVTFLSDPSNRPRTAYKTVWGCHIKNAGQPIVAGASNAPEWRHVYIGDCWLNGWYDYGMLLGDAGIGEFGWCGVRAQQPTGTRNGNVKYGLSDGYDWPNHGPVRVTRAVGPCTFHNCDIACFNDWSSAGGATSATKYAMNPTIRWNSGLDSESADQVLVIDRIRSEGFPVEALNEQTGSQRWNAYALIDRFYMTMTSHQAGNNGHAGTTWRNGVFLVPNTIPGASTGLQNQPIEDTAYPWGAGLSNANARRVEIYSCALIDLRSDVNSQTRTRANGGTVISPRNYPSFETSVVDSYIGNILGYAPNRSSATGFSAHNPVKTDDGFTPVWGGEYWKATSLKAGTTYTSAATASYRPLTGSPAIGGATGKVSLLDFDGNLRSEILAGLTRSVPSIGPYEPDLEN